MDPRFKKLAEVLVFHSMKVAPKEKVILHQIDAVPDEFMVALIRAVRLAGGYPVVWHQSNVLHRELLMHATSSELEATLALRRKADRMVMKQAAAYVGVRGAANSFEEADVPQEAQAAWMKGYLVPVHFQVRVPHTKWVVLRWPTPSMAQKAKMSTEAFTEFFFRVCTLDYSALETAMCPLKDLWDQTDKVKITGPGTDITFSIKGIPAVICAGEHNIPDGELFGAPILDSVEGVITFNTPTTYQGKQFAGVKLVVEAGRIVEATCQSGDPEKLNAILDTNKGSRFFGEFAIGVNPRITSAMDEILFDEKIRGSIHLTPGQCYKEAPNGNNKAAIHWDMVQIQTEDFVPAGAEPFRMYFDGVLVRENGVFTLPKLQPLDEMI